MTRTPRLLFLTLLGLLCIALMVRAQEQTQLAATLEVLKAGVEVKRVDTPNWISVKLEAIVGVGDEIRTDVTGSARITFFSDGVDTDVLPNTTYRIAEFKGNDTSFTLSAEVLVGQTTQRLGRTLDANSSYNITTPGMVLAARGTRFAVRVEDTGRAGMLVQEGTVAASNEATEAKVPPEFGIRAVADEPLSDVVRASTFDELDAALDGCSAQISTFDDVRLNVRLGPNRSAQRVGTADPADLSTLIGISTNGNDKGAWYRVAFNGGYGWVLSSSTKINPSCAGLREFEASWVEDASLYTSLGETISLDVTPAATEATPEATVEATAEATAEGK